ncbi:response regulator [Methanoregula sp.]|uniref:response regulator n=1 Tax=Methanoregula sp. TaxID=2052170 RepID=UPI002371FC21|nr:response regulator [Methanoregula sp.]MDD1685358.1 response regulator [Methanoregula sp.]
MGQPRIVIVEDDDILAKTTEWRVRKLGYGFSGRAASGKEAIGLIMREHPDVILMDINIRGELDGIEVAELIRTQFDIPVIFMTANMDKETIARAKATGPKGYLVKPFDDQDLRVAIELAIP